MKDWRHYATTAGIGVLMALFAPSPSSAAIVTFFVNSTRDAVDAKPGDGICQTTTSNECTLRAGIMEINTGRFYPSELVLQSGRSTTVIADKERIGQVMTNLVMNAIKYSPRGGKVIIRSELDEEKDEEVAGIEKEHEQVADREVLPEARAPRVLQQEERRRDG